MKLNKKELKKLQYDFNSICNRLLQADYQDYPEVLGKFLKFINNAPIIIDYIKDCGFCNWNLEETIQDVQKVRTDGNYSVLGIRTRKKFVMFMLC